MIERETDDIVITMRVWLFQVQVSRLSDGVRKGTVEQDTPNVVVVV